MKSTFVNALIVLDKPAGMTSRDLVNRVQRLLPRGTKIGHAGTLDPLATGVLVLCIGAATRLIEYVQALDKEYVAELVLGAESDTDDADGLITQNDGGPPPPLELIEDELRGFVGKVEQTPPRYSAVKVSGRRAHSLARKGGEFSLPGRTVNIYSIEICQYAYPFLTLRISCGRGTYIRSIARDLGRRLGCGAYVQSLRRTRIGPFSEDKATPFTIPLDRNALKPLPMESAVSMLPKMHLTREQATRLQQGQKISVKTEPYPSARPEAEVALFCEADFFGIGLWRARDKRLAPAKILRLDEQ